MEQLLRMQVCAIVFIFSKMFYRMSQNQIVGVDDRNNWNELQSNLCSVVIVSRLLRSSYRISADEVIECCSPTE